MNFLGHFFFLQLTNSGSLIVGGTKNRKVFLYFLKIKQCKCILSQNRGIFL